MVINLLLWGLLITAGAYGAQTTHPFPYYSDTNQIKQIPYLEKGHTILQKDKPIFTGPKYPLVVWNTATNKTLVTCETNITSLIEHVRDFFGTDKSKIKVYLKAHTFEYSDSADENAVPLQISCEEKKNGELQALFHALQAFVEPQNVQKYILSGRHLPYGHQLRNYLTAPLFIVINQTRKGPQFFHICPIEYFPIAKHLEDPEDKIDHLRKQLMGPATV